MRRPLLLLGVAALAALGLLFQPVRVVGPSMLPSLKEGELRLTRPLWAAPPERHDLVVFREPDSEQVAVKRIAGLPGERVRLLDGDLFIDGARFQRAVNGADSLVPLVDAAGEEIAAQFNVGARSQAQSGFLHDSGRAFLRSVPLDGYLLDGQLIEGQRPASDLGLAAEFELLEPGSLFELLVVEGDATFSLSLGEGRCSLWEGDQLLESAEVPFDLRSGRLFLGKVDQLLYACLDGQPLFEPVPFTTIDPPDLVGGAPGPPFEQAGFGGHQVLLRRIRVGRDLYRDPSGTYACSRELQLTEDQYFLLGDNPEASRDSRHYGPVPRERLLGVVQARLWSPGRD